MGLVVDKSLSGVTVGLSGISLAWNPLDDYNPDGGDVVGCERTEGLYSRL